MAATLIASALLLAAQATAPAAPAEPQVAEQREVAGESGRAPQQAAAPEANVPAGHVTFVDLGTPYPQEDAADRAERAYHAASAGRSGYRLSLADGSTADVRSAARREVRTAARTEPPATLDQ